MSIAKIMPQRVEGTSGESIVYCIIVSVRLPLAQKDFPRISKWCFLVFAQWDFVTLRGIIVAADHCFACRMKPRPWNCAMMSPCSLVIVTLCAVSDRDWETSWDSAYNVPFVTGLKKEI